MLAWINGEWVDPRSIITAPDQEIELFNQLFNPNEGDTMRLLRISPEHWIDPALVERVEQDRHKTKVCLKGRGGYLTLEDTDAGEVVDAIHEALEGN